MSANLPLLIDQFAGRNVLVLGEAMLDSYLEGAAGRFCQEAPVPIVTLSGRRDLPGGAANTAVNVHQLGGRVHFLSVIGQDAEGALLRQALEGQGVATEHVFTHATRRTLAKQRVVAASQILLRLDQGSTKPVDEEAERLLIQRLAGLFPRCDAVILSDYAYGILTPGIVRALADLQARWSRVVVADSRRLAVFRDVGVTAVKPNYDEAVALLGARALEGCRVRAEGVARYGEPLLDLTGSQIVAVTLDSEGALVFERGRSPYRSYARAVRHACVAGAGDTFVAALALGLAAGAPTPAAAELASAAAAVVVGKERTATCSAQELREYVSAEGKYYGDLQRLVARVEFYRQQGRRIVFTNGCFDILHRGHITYLNRAKMLGDVLIVGVNSDESIHRLKGPDRPINTLEDRIQVLAALSCVDHLVAFGDDTPCNLIRALRPDVFVKGGDYTRERLPEAPLVEELGGVVQILPYLEDRSTTGLIERIQEVYAQPARGGVRT
jgi:D-beta-D-heptose 7-phosphate kinase/D-beta-D-heptose 1-phosphate adenosyltransferase